MIGIYYWYRLWLFVNGAQTLIRLLSACCFSSVTFGVLFFQLQLKDTFPYAQTPFSSLPAILLKSLDGCHHPRWNDFVR